MQSNYATVHYRYLSWAFRLSMFSLLFILGCTVYPETAMCSTLPTTMQPSTISQGIQGTIRQLSGDQMPTTDPQTEGTEERVSTTVWIFSDRIAAQGSPQWSVVEAQQHPNFVCKVESDDSGQYQVQLPAGEYTVFAQYAEILYLNAFQGDGSYQSVEVAPEQVSELDLTHTERAFF